MSFLDFLELLVKSKFNPEAVSALFTRYVSSITSDSESVDKSVIESFISDLPDEQFSSFVTILNFCSDEYTKQLGFSDIITPDFQSQLDKAKFNIDLAIGIYNTVAEKKHTKPNDEDSVNTAIAHHELKLEEINDAILSLHEKVEAANSMIDNKIFTLLVNTVAVLGIFVAIAFAGFGSFSLFQSITFEMFLGGLPSFIKSVFYILLIFLASYNLLFLLVYFIFKLSRPILDNKVIQEDGSDHGGKERFKNLVSLSNFLWIDGFLFALTVAAFIASCIIK